MGLQIIQDASPDTEVSTLVLIHDASGHAHSYSLLGPLGREVLTISDPRRNSGQPFWPGGILAMARHYANLIKRAVPFGSSVILGGWSFGGTVALQLAVILQEDDSITVCGVLLLDTPNFKKYPVLLQMPPADLRKFFAALDTEKQAKVIEAFARARDMLTDWDMGDSNVLLKEGIPTVVVRAIRAVPVTTNDPSLLLDARGILDDQNLGWGQVRQVAIKAILNVDGHHFSVLSSGSSAQLTQNIMTACKILEG